MINGIPEVRPIEGYDGYFVSEIGEVYSIRPKNGSFKKGYIRGLMHEMTPHENIDGYLTLGIFNNSGKRCDRRVHRLLATAFIPNPNNYPVVNHKDGNVTNNSLDNLEWCTISDNTSHAYNVLGVTPNGCKPVKLTNRKSGEESIFRSIKDCAQYLNMSYDHLRDLFYGIRCSFDNWALNDIYKVELIE